MRALLLLSAPSLLFFSACKQDPEVEPEIEALREARRELRAVKVDLERAQKDLAAQQEKLDQEREKVRHQASEVGEAQLETYEGQLAREQELDVRSDEAELREEVLAQWEEALGELEQEVAGQEALVDWIPEEPEVFEEPVADYGLFYDELDDYGSWYESQDYGYVYQPLIVVQDNSWRPYTCGRWVCTSQGWCWVSDEPFGWACYHYGRWCKVPRRGWCWVPGNKWAPSWCAWREGAGHVGWAPLPPESMVGRGKAWGRGADRELCIPDDAFCFVESKHMADRAWRHCLPSGRNGYLRARTRCCTNLHDRGGQVIAGGPRWRGVREKVGRAWPVRELEFDPIGGLSGERARHGFAKGTAWRVFNPSVNVPWNLRLRPEHLAGRMDHPDGSPTRQSGVWTEQFQEARQAQVDRAREWSGPTRSDLEINRESVASAQPIYQDRVAGVRQSLSDRPRRPRESETSVAGGPTGESAAQPSRPPRANVPPALGRLLPPGVVALPEGGRTVAQSIAARAESRTEPEGAVPVVEVVPTTQPLGSQSQPPSGGVRTVPIMPTSRRAGAQQAISGSTTQPNAQRADSANVRGGGARGSSGPIATIGRPVPQPRPERTTNRPTPSEGSSTASNNPSSARAQARPTSGQATQVRSTSNRRQSQVNQAILQQQQLVRGSQSASRQVATHSRGGNSQSQSVSRSTPASRASASRQGGASAATVSQPSRPRPTAQVPSARRNASSVNSRQSVAPARSTSARRSVMSPQQSQMRNSVRGRAR